MRSEPDLSWLANMPPQRVIVSFTSGVAGGDAPGLVLKLLLADEHSELAFIPPGLIGAVLDGCRQFLAESRLSSATSARADSVFVSVEPTFDEQDFAAVRQADVAVQAGFLAMPNALGCALWFTDRRRRGFLMAPAVAFRLGELLTRVRPHLPPVPGRDIPHRN